MLRYVARHLVGQHLNHAPFCFHAAQNWTGNSGARPERELWAELRRCGVMCTRVSGAAAYCPHGWLGSAKPDGALSSISMSPTQIATFIHSSHTITPKRLKASPSINRGKFVFLLQSNKTPTEMKTSEQRLQYHVSSLFVFMREKCVCGVQGQSVKAW